MMIPIAKPIIGEEEINAVTSVLKSGNIAQGEKVKEIEEAFAEFIGTKYAVAVNSGTAALHIALLSSGIKQSDEVITTPFTFIATANSILFQGAKTIFADVNGRTFNINPDDVLEKITVRTKAIIGVHLFGHPFDVKEMQEICEDYNLILIEDCAQAHGAEYHGKKVGCFGIGCFSFYATKNMITGEGGMITTDRDEIAKVCKLLRSHGESQKYSHTMLGYNYRMTDIQAAIGLAQLKKLNEFNEKRINNAKYLDKHIKVSGLELPYRKDEIKYVYHQYAVTIEEGEGFPMSRDEFMEYLKNKGIGCAIHYPLPIHKQSLYQQLGYTDANVKCPVATALSKNVLSLPVHPALSDEELKYIVEVINSYER